MTSTKSRINFAFLGLAALTAGCAATPQPPVPPAGPGYADGIKDHNTPNLTFQGTSKGLSYLATPGGPTSGGWNGVADGEFTLSTTSDPDKMIITINGTDTELVKDQYGSFNSSDGLIFVTEVEGSQDGQVTIFAANIQSAGNTGWGGFVPIGLQTDPAQITARSGTASYSGAGILYVMHGGDFDSGDFTSGTGTATLTADFGAGTIGGSMLVTDDFSDPGFEVAPGGATITFDPTAISGNGFTGSWSIANPGDLALSSVSGGAWQGNFFGVNGADVAGSFNGSGTSLDGTTPAYIAGSFIGE